MSRQQTKIETRARHFELIKRCLANERRAWDELVREFSGLVYFAICHAAKSNHVSLPPETVHDIHNGLFLSLLNNGGRKLTRFSGRCSFSNWIKVVSVNYTIDQLRRLKPTVSLDAPEYGNGFLERVCPAVASAEAQIDEREDVETLFSAIDLLTDGDRLFLKLIYVDDASPGAIAAVLNSSVGAVYARKHRLIKKLKENVERLRAADPGA